MTDPEIPTWVISLVSGGGTLVLALVVWWEQRDIKRALIEIIALLAARTGRVPTPMPRQKTGPVQLPRDDEFDQS